MFKFKNKKAFTLIELLVVIAIIGLLATISVIALNNARAKSRDAKRIADIKQVQTALELFFNDKGRYPSEAEFLAGSIMATSSLGTTTYMVQIPTASNPPDGDCLDTENQFSYAASTDGSTYTLSYCLGNTTGALAAGPKCATPAGMINGECLPIPAGGGSQTNPCLTDPTGCGWIALGSNFSHDSVADDNLGLAFDTNGIPYAAYSGQANQKANVMKYSGSSWVAVGPVDFSPSNTQNISISMDGNIPYVTYEDYSIGGGITVKRYNSGADSWDDVGPTNSIGTGWPKLAVYNGVPYVFFTDYNNGGRPSVKKYDSGSDSWLLVGPAGFIVDSMNQPKISIYNNVPYVAFSNNSTGSVLVMKYNSGSDSWEYLGGTSSFIGASFPDLFVTSGGVLYLAYSDGNSGNRTNVKIYDSGSDSWSFVGSANFSSGVGYSPSVYVYNNTPYVVFSDGNNGYQPTLMKFDGGSWSIVGSVGLVFENSLWDNFLAQIIKSAQAAALSSPKLLFYNGTPYVLYKDLNNSSYLNLKKFELLP